jgi:biopolymer transport protein ExbD
MPLRARQDEQLGINMTPMVDVLFTLIIFFMVGAKFNDDQRQLNVTLPAVNAAASASAAVRPRAIRIEANGTVYLDEQIVTLRELTDKLKSPDGQPKGRVMIHGDATVPFQGIASVLSATREAGIQDMSIAVRLQGARH